MYKRILKNNILYNDVNKIEHRIKTMEWRYDQ